MIDAVNNWLKGRKQKSIKPVALSGYIFSIVNITQDKEFKCKHECIYGKGSPCLQWPYKVKNEKFQATEVVLNVIATEASHRGWRVENRDLKIMDEKGFSYDGYVLCDYIGTNVQCTTEGGYIHPYTQSNIVYVFNMPRGAKVGGAIITNGNESARFEFEDLDNKEIFSSDFYHQLESSLSQGTYDRKGNSVHYRGVRKSIIDDYKLERLKEDINYIKLQIFKRLNNDLLSSEQKSIEEKIANRAYQVELTIKSNGWENSTECQDLVADFRTSMEQYEFQLSARREFDQQREIKIQRVIELQSVKPYVFEHISASVMAKQGYEKVKVTRQSNDKGIDIICEKDGLLYVAQCKRYAATVGSPDMQKFIGAMQNARADRGVFITTSTFTREASIMANENNVELVDKYKLAEWLSLTDDYSERSLFD